MKKLIAIIVVIILGIGGYFALQPPPVGEEKPKTEEKESEATIIIENFSFKLATLNVKVGTKVSWVNQDSVRHTVTSDSGTELNSELLPQGESYSHIFEKTGTFEYHCTPHPFMKGKVVVEE